MIKSPPKASMEASVNELTTAMGQLLRRLRSETGSDELNLSQLGVLGRLDQQGPMTTADLARSESMKPQSMGTILAGLEQEGLVQRKPHPSDGRQILFAMTDKAIGIRRKRGNAKREWLLAALATLNPAEQRTLMDAIPLIKRLSES
ncbi:MULTISPECIES: MarR family transcriptional regulator [unclassified Dyella]|uniref:MarR family winged helix-turn-helix transcriptional regulator n=1 Tax=unclassified Dyella TaxID=2634549 RepID=UPI000C852383|nr:MULTISPECIES: MarR family transcriptional regulator [unclassified Dyella]MDR3447710.1 MarR family transcriptional regulator [Dyella sp.]PMQ05372.1 putative HTH-type transcriptional regulator [Dyella sp. AD56]